MQIIKRIYNWLLSKSVNEEPVSISIANLMAYNKPFVVGTNHTEWNFDFGNIRLLLYLNKRNLLISYEVNNCTVAHIVGGDDVKIFIRDTTGTVHKTCVNLSEIHGIDFGYVLQEHEILYLRMLV